MPRPLRNRPGIAELLAQLLPQDDGPDIPGLNTSQGPQLGGINATGYMSEGGLEPLGYHGDPWYAPSWANPNNMGLGQVWGGDTQLDQGGMQGSVDPNMRQVYGNAFDQEAARIATLGQAPQPDYSGLSQYDPNPNPYGVNLLPPGVEDTAGQYPYPYPAVDAYAGYGADAHPTRGPARRIRPIRRPAPASYGAPTAANRAV